jgi:hypothetical protein
MPRNKDREKARLARKKMLAVQQVQQFEDEISGHELNIARLKAAGQPTEAEEAAIAAIEKAIETTEAEATKIST